MERTWDVVVFGATGFTGGLAAEYLAQRHAGSGLRFAIAGRSKQKLADRRRELEAIAPECRDVGVIEAMSDDPDSLAGLAASTRVLLTTVGPYTRLGEPVVAACVEAGTDYVDITGEPGFVGGIVERHDARARERGVRIVPCCGFDSIPPDLGTWFVVRQLPDDRPIVVECFVRGSGTFSGGTWHSALEIFADLGKANRDAGRIAPTGETGDGRRVGLVDGRVRWDAPLESWAAPLPTIDPRIVLRSARALPAYGPDFRYGHYARVKRLPMLVAGGAGIGALLLLARFGPTRDLLRRVRSPGEGPSAEQRARGSFELHLRGRAGPHRVEAAVSGGDPGYTETAKMCSEAALCLALDRERLPDAAGVLTPAIAMGDLLVERLREAGIRFESLARS